MLPWRGGGSWGIDVEFVERLSMEEEGVYASGNLYSYLFER